MIKALNYNELKSLCKMAQALGILTLAELAEFIRYYNIEDKRDLINSINNLFINL